MNNERYLIASFFKSLRFTILVACLCLSFLLTSCNLDSFKTNGARIPQLVFASPSDPATFNSALNDSAFSVFGYIYDGLVSENGQTAELEPALAESWQVSDDKKTITFKLREDLKWSDGEPLSADDVVFTYNDIYLNEQVPTGIRDILRIGSKGTFPSVKKIDDRQVEFSVSEPFAPFLRYAGGIPIMPKHALEESIRTKDASGNLKFLTKWGTDTDPKQIVGNGYYTIDSFVPSQRVILKRNPYYWRKDTQGNAQPYIEKVVLRIIQSDDTQLVGFRSGDMDSLEVKPEVFSLLKKEENIGKFKIYNGGPSSESRFVSFNLNKARSQKGKPFVDPIKSAWFNNLAFRQAIAYAIDRESMINSIYRGIGAIQHSAIGEDSPFYLSPQEGLKTYSYNLEKAKQLLKDAGFKYNEFGELLDSDGHRIQFTMLVKAEEESRVDAAVQVQQDLKKIGIKVNLQPISFNTIVQKLKNRDWECYVGGFAGGGSVEPHSSFNIWSSQGMLHQFNQGQIPGQPPIQGWEVSDWEKEIDKLFAEGAKELDQKKRKEIYGRFQQIAAEQLPFFYLINPIALQAVRDRIENVKFTSLGGAFWNFYELKISD
jgi:peptide/nickel transport system substrate-binding protein